MTTTDPKQPGINPQSKFNLGDTVLCLSDGLEWTVAGFTDHYVILGTHAHHGCIKEFADFITYDRTFTTYRFARPEKLTPKPDIEEKNGMEEKELNLCELLKGCEGEVLYSPTYGKCTLRAIYASNNRGFQPIISVRLEDGTSRNFASNGKIAWAVSKFAPISLFPYSLYEKYPLDAKKAWQEWEESRKPKRWRAEERERYWVINHELEVDYSEDVNDGYDNARWKVGNYFRTASEAKQAAEEVKQCLEAFHTRNGNI